MLGPPVITPGVKPVCNAWCYNNKEGTRKCKNRVFFLQILKVEKKVFSNAIIARGSSINVSKICVHVGVSEGVHHCPSDGNFLFIYLLGNSYNLSFYDHIFSLCHFAFVSIRIYSGDTVLKRENSSFSTFKI